MRRVAWQDRIAIAPNLHHGDPCIKGTRILVAMIVGSLADGTTPVKIRKAYPQLEEDDTRAALSYVADLAHEDLSPTERRYTTPSSIDASGHKRRQNYGP